MKFRVSLFNLSTLFIAGILTFIFSTAVDALISSYLIEDDANSNIRIHGAASGDGIGWSGFSFDTEDMNSDGKADLIISVYRNDSHSRNNNGAIYIIYNELLEDLALADLDLSNPAHYNLKFEGEFSGDEIGSQGMMQFQGDFDGDNKKDLVIGDQLSDANGGNSGAVYVIYDDLLTSWTGTGNDLDLADSNNYSFMIYGNTNDRLARQGLAVGDMNNNGSDELFIGSRFNDGEDQFSAAIIDSGSTFVLYDDLMATMAAAGPGSNDFLISDTNNYTVRIDGANASDIYGAFGMAAYDINADGKDDFISTSFGTDYNSRPDSGSHYILLNDQLSGYTGTGNHHPLADDNNYDLRLDAPENEGAGVDATSEVWLGFSAFTILDIDGDNILDISTGSFRSDTPTVPEVGNMFIIYGKNVLNLLNSGACPAKACDLQDHLNVRLVGESQGDLLGIYQGARSADWNGDGNNDYIVGGHTDLYGNNSGTMYIVDGAILGDYSQKGLWYRLNNPSTILHRYDGNNSSLSLRFFGVSTLDTADINEDGRADIIVGADESDSLSRSNNGRLWIIYNFPHSITADAVDEYNETNITGNISAPESVTDIDLVQWSTSNNPQGSWQACSPTDGTFDSNNEDYDCDISGLADGNYNIYIRAVDTDIKYTYQEHYKKVAIKIDRTAEEPVITDIGMITNVPNQSSLFYYFTSETPVIKGYAEPNSTIYFMWQGNTYSSQVNSEGIFSVVIENPGLPRTYNEIEYYIVDQAGNMSGTRNLFFIIGIENFPDELKSLLSGTDEDDLDLAVQNEMQEEIEDMIIDQVENQPELMDLPETGDEVTVEQTNESSNFFFICCCLVILVIVLIFLFAAYYKKKKKKEKK